MSDLRGLVLPYKGIMPRIAEDVFIAPTAVIVGDVEIGPGSSIWYGCVVRADVHSIRIGTGTNIQDGTVIHVSGGTHATTIGDDVLVGHLAMIHGCTLQDRAFVGMRATILDGAVVESDAMVAAGALVSPRKVVKSGQLWAGSPATYMRDLTQDEIARFKKSTAGYAANAKLHMESITSSR